MPTSQSCLQREDEDQRAAEQPEDRVLLAEFPAAHHLQDVEEERGGSADGYDGYAVHADSRIWLMGGGMGCPVRDDIQGSADLPEERRLLEELLAPSKEGDQERRSEGRDEMTVTDHDPVVPEPGQCPHQAGFVEGTLRHGLLPDISSR